MDITEFPSGVIEHLGWYVYRLIDPRDGSTFYVGKGKGNRVFAHMRGEVAATDDDELLSNKLKQIREIRLSGISGVIAGAFALNPPGAVAVCAGSLLPSGW